MAGLLEVVVILWKSIHRSMEKNKEARLYTIDKFASVLPEYLKVFQVRLTPVSSRIKATGAGPAEVPNTSASSVTGGPEAAPTRREAGL